MLSFLQRWRRRPEAWSDDDHILAYLEGRESETDIASLNLDSEAKAEFRAELSSLRETVALLRSLDAVEPKGSFVLTAENLSRRGYNDRQIESILAPRRTSSWSRTGIGRVPVYVPAAISVIALLGVAMLAIGDIREYVSDNLLSRSETQMEVAVQIESAGDPGRPGMPVSPSMPSLKATVAVEKQVVVEKEVVVEIETVELERKLRAVEAGLPDIPYLEEAMEKEAMVGSAGTASDELQEVAVEKQVEVEKEVILEVDTVELERKLRAGEAGLPDIPYLGEAMGKEAMVGSAGTASDELQEMAVEKEIVVESEDVATEQESEAGIAAPRGVETDTVGTRLPTVLKPTQASPSQGLATLETAESEDAFESRKDSNMGVSQYADQDYAAEDAAVEDRRGWRFHPLLFVFLAGLFTAIAFWIFVTRIKSIK